MAWWLKNNLRLIQNNMRDIDGAMDVDSLVKTLREFECNVARVGAGGITSFYPTKLAYQSPSPFLEGRDILGEIVEKCHKEGIRIIGRFDFSKTHERFYEDHKDWYFKNHKGEIIHYNDTVQTCLNGWYQQEYSLEVIREALERYPLDGVFFNMFGFHSWDYSGNRYGICHCDNCKERFAQYTGGAMELPFTESAEEPAYAAYELFKKDRVAEIMNRVQRCVRSFGPEIAVCTSNPNGVDILHNESNSALERPYPFQLMHSSANVSRVRHNFEDKIISNCVINAADLWWRFTGVSEDLTAIRLYESIAAGSGLDFCIIGAFDDYPDTRSVESAKEVFRFHKKNEEYYGHLVSQARLMMVQPLDARPVIGGSKEFHGLFKALKEEHIPFDVIADARILENPSKFSHYAAAIIPGLAGIDQKVVQVLAGIGVKTIVTAVTSPLDESVAREIGFQIIESTSDTKGAYLLASEKEIFTHFVGRDWIVLTQNFGVAKAPGWTKLLLQVSKAWFGPPERAFGHKVTDFGGVFVSRDKSITIYTWQPGELYHQYGSEDHKFALVDLLDWLAPQVRVVRIDAPNCVELFYDKTGEHILLQLLNLSGFNGTTVSKHLPVSNIRVRFPFTANCAKSLCGGKVQLKPTQEGCELCIDTLERFEAIVID